MKNEVVSTKTSPSAREVWVWEYGTRDGRTVHNATEYWELPALKAAVDASFTDYAWEEVERRGIRGTSVLVKTSGRRYEDTGHWVYRKPARPAADDGGEYVRTYYRVPARIGMAIEFDDRPAVITGFDGQYLLIRLEGDDYDSKAHPTWQIRYPDENGKF